VDQQASDDNSSSCNLSESDFRSIEKNLENEILNQSFEDMPAEESEEEISDVQETNSIGSQILTRKRLRIFDEITQEAESGELPKRLRQKAACPTPGFGLKLEVCPSL